MRRMARNSQKVGMELDSLVVLPSLEAKLPAYYLNQTHTIPSLRSLFLCQPRSSLSPERMNHVYDIS